MFPESEKIETSITIRKMRRLGGSALTKKSLLRWFALSLGLMNPRDSRETILDILDALFFFNLSQGRPTTAEEISSRTGIDEKTVLYHLSRLKRMGLLESRGGRYEFARDLNGKPSLEKFRSIIDESLNRSELALLEITRIYSP